jgi:hypothetical protein
MLQFMQKEVEENEFDIPMNKVHERVVTATGVYKSSLKTMKNEMLQLQAGAATS